MSVFAVDEQSVRPLGPEIWKTTPGWQTATSSTTWMLRPAVVHAAAPGAAIVLVPRSRHEKTLALVHDTSEACVVATADDDAHDLRRAISKLGGIPCDDDVTADASSVPRSLTSSGE